LRFLIAFAIFKIMKYLLILLLPIFWACTAATPSEPPQCNQEVDFYGDAFWILTHDSLNARMVTNLEGNLRTARGAITDSGQIVSGIFVGTLHAPLGDVSFDSTGTIFVSGLLKQNLDRYNIVYNVEFGTDGFVKTRGYFEFDWGATEDRIYYVGTFCFE
jgi:hypothetical protein